MARRRLYDLAMQEDSSEDEDMLTPIRRPRWIQTAEDVKRAQTEFYNTASFPRVVGAIDCTHVKIKSPGGNNAELFRCRKGFFSLNVQAICNANLEFIDLVARWPGSTHDSVIFQNCFRKSLFDSGRYGNSVMVGDSGYRCNKYMMTPLDNPATPAEHLYNEAQIRTRNSIERMFGIWKRRFPVLALGMRVDLRNVFPIVVATAVLHNILQQRGEPVPPFEVGFEARLPAPWEIIMAEGQIDNVNVDQQRRVNPEHQERHSIVNQYFTRLVEIERQRRPN
nr:unnamed protein product [Callosobruchus chinensis]